MKSRPPATLTAAAAHKSARSLGPTKH
jgi:hypothetical protein